MSTDHPNGGSFLAYPQIIRLLMDRTYRRDMLKTLPAAVRERTAAQGPRPGILPRRRSPSSRGPARRGCSA